MTDRSDDQDVLERIARLEAGVAALTTAIRELRSEERAGDEPALKAGAAPGPSTGSSPEARPQSPPASPAPGQPARPETTGRPPRPPRAPRKKLDLPSLSDLLAPEGALLSRVGIFLIILAIMFFFKYSIDEGWLIPSVRIAIGFAAGGGLLVLGARGAVRGEHLGTALAGGAIATFFITGYAAHQWYSLIPYLAAFGVLVAASALGIALSLKSNRQALAIVGLGGALSTPVLLVTQSLRIESHIGFICLVVASIVAVYMSKAWRLLLMLAVVTGGMAIAAALGQAEDAALSASAWAVQAGIIFCAAAFWMAPVVRAVLRARAPDPWPRPKSRSGFPWSAHLDLLSLGVPVIAIGFSTVLWDLSRDGAGWAFLGTAAVVFAFGYVVNQMRDPEESASTQFFVSLLLATAGLGLVLEAEAFYLVLALEAAVLIVLGVRKNSLPLEALGAVMQLTVVAMFASRILTVDTLAEGNVSALTDLAAIAAAVVIGTQMKGAVARGGFFFAAYIGLLVFTGRELADYPTALYAVILVEAAGIWALGLWRSAPVLVRLGHFGMFVVGWMFLAGFDGAARGFGEDRLLLLLDIVVLGAATWVGTRVLGSRLREDRTLGEILGTQFSESGTRSIYLGAAYLGLLALTVRELTPLDHGPALASLGLGLEGAAVLVLGFIRERAVLQRVGMITLLLVAVKLLLMDMAAVDPLWRVLLFLLIGGLFLVVSKVTQGSGAGAGGGEGESEPRAPEPPA